MTEHPYMYPGETRMEAINRTMGDDHPIRKKDREWLDQVREWTDHPPGMYRGMRVDHLPDSVAYRLRTRRRHLIRLFVPENPAHKDRWVITRAGRKLLEES